MTPEQEAFFNSFYEETHKALYKYILCLVSDKWYAEDIMNETYEGFSENIVTALGCDSPKGYLYGIAIHKVNKHYEKQKRISEHEAPLDDRDEWLNPLAQAETREEFLLSLPVELSAFERELLTMRIFDKYTSCEAGELLGFTEEAMKSRYRRAKERCKILLENNDPNFASSGTI